MRYLVTGGAGFIGSTLARHLLEQGHTVRVLDDFSTGKEKNLAQIASDIEVQHGSIVNAKTVRTALKDVDGVFHLAAVASVQRSMEKPEECHAINVTGFLNILEGCRQAEVKRVVYSTSAATYGEIDRFPLAESEPCEPISPYGLHKWMNEEMARLYNRRGWVSSKGLRYFNVFGPRQDPHGDYAAVVPKFITAFLAKTPPTIFGDGSQSRDFLFVEDVALANRLAMDSPKGDGEVFNVCAGNETSLLQLVEVLQKLVSPGLEPNFEAKRSGDIRRSVGNPAKAREILNFSPEFTVSEGLARTVQWFRTSG